MLLSRVGLRFDKHRHSLLELSKGAGCVYYPLWNLGLLHQHT